MREIAKIKKDIFGKDFWELRLGLHTGKAMTGVVGKNKFTYDVWGDSVNIASRMESSSEPGRINISGDTYKHVKSFFNCEYRGYIAAKNLGKKHMYFLNRINETYSHDAKGLVPNKLFREHYNKLKLKKDD
jgi:class 3 adenylate cyclase